MPDKDTDMLVVLLLNIVKPNPLQGMKIKLYLWDSGGSNPLGW